VGGPCSTNVENEKFLAKFCSENLMVKNNFRYLDISRRTDMKYL